jgi:hypothetical protein
MKTLTTLSLIALSFTSIAQSPNYDDLKILYADANYEKLVKEADGYTLNEKTKKDIPPYFWAAKGLYKISLSGTDDERFKNAYKEAITFLGKGMSYDAKYNSGSYTKEESEFVGKFQMSLVETIENDIAANAWKKAYGWAIKYQKITTDLTGIYFLQGACKYYDLDKTTARDMWKKAEIEMAKIESIDDWSEADKKVLKLGILYSAKALKDSRQVDKAKTLLGKAGQWFENDDDWKEKYDEIVNS